MRLHSVPDRSLSQLIAHWAVRQEEAGHPTTRRQDKKGSPVDRQAIDMACLSPGASVGWRAAQWENPNGFNRSRGTAPRLISALW
jgi:hypothetical protein